MKKEWPKKSWEFCIDADNGPQPDVIPADLGDELYKALIDLYADGDETDKKTARSVLARYEREVGP